MERTRLKTTTNETESPPPLDWKARGQKVWREWAKPFLIILIIGTSLRSAVADWNYVPTGSMKPTILEGDRIFVNRLAYDLKVPFTTWHLMEWAGPDRGDVVVLYSPADDKRLVKRVVGVPGDQIEITDGRLLVNGEPAEYEPLEQEIRNELDKEQQRQYEFARERIGEAAHPVMLGIEPSPLATYGPVTIPDGHYFVMGDNRDNSFDSRWFGFVERRRILGRATAVAISNDPQRFFMPRWHRFFRGLP